MGLFTFQSQNPSPCCLQLSFRRGAKNSLDSDHLVKAPLARAADRTTLTQITKQMQVRFILGVAVSCWASSYLLCSRGRYFVTGNPGRMKKSEDRRESSVRGQ